MKHVKEDLYNTMSKIAATVSVVFILVRLTHDFKSEMNCILPLQFFAPRVMRIPLPTFHEERTYKSSAL